MRSGAVILKFMLALFVAGSLLSCKQSRNAEAKTVDPLATPQREKAAATAETPKAAEPLRSEGEQQEDAPSRPKPEYPDSLFLRMYKTPCFGQCPVYRVDVYQSGWAYMEGERFFDYEGTFKSRFSEVEMAQIVKLAEDHNYFGLRHVYDAPVTDLPSTTTVLQTQTQEQWVYNRMNSPDELKEFERELEAIIKEKEWQPYKRGDKK